MTPEDIVPLDWIRLVIGELPGLFYLEIVLRTLAIYAWTLAMVRWIGGRSVKQLSLVDYVLVIALGSAVGDAAFYAEVPLLQAMLVVTLIVVFTKAIESLVRRVPRIGFVIDDEPIEAVRDGRLHIAALARRNLPPGSLFEMLRERDVANLGELQAAWIEGGGGISLLRAEPARPGLPIMPPHELRPPDKPGPDDKTAVCRGCGAPHDAGTEACSECSGRGWAKAILGPSPLD